MTRRILVVEDNATIAEGIRMNLAVEGHAVEIAATGERGLTQIRRWDPDLVILDWNAPGQPAGEVLAALRADAVTRDAKILLLVDHEHSGSAEVARTGADERLVAPFSPMQLQIKLRKLLGPSAIAG